ncbi:MAG: oligosaccharide flippase family protein [Dysosmobacter sp.]
MLTFSTAGLPLAISRMTSQAHAKGLENEKRRIFSTAIWLFFGLGLVCSVLMFFRADALARFLNNSLAATAVQALAPAVFCVCLLACMRGYTQGQGNMTPTAVSQVLEALLKLGIGLPLAWYVLQHRQDRGAQRGGAIVGVTAAQRYPCCSCAPISSPTGTGRNRRTFPPPAGRSLSRSCSSAFPSP